MACKTTTLNMSYTKDKDNYTGSIAIKDNKGLDLLASTTSSSMSGMVDELVDNLRKQMLSIEEKTSATKKDDKMVAAIERLKKENETLRAENERLKKIRKEQDNFAEENLQCYKKLVDKYNKLFNY